MEMENSILLLGICLVLTCVYYVLGLVSSKRSKLPPGPAPLPIVGNIFQLGPKPNESLAELAKKYGPLMTLKLGQVTSIVITSVEGAREALLKNDRVLSGRTVPDGVRTRDYHLASVAWLPPNDTWRKLRMLFTKRIFATSRLDASAGLRQEKVRHLLHHVSNSCRSGEGVNIGRLVHSTMINLISNTAYSMDMVDPVSPAAQEFKEITRSMEEEAGRPNIVDFFPFLRPFDPQSVRRRLNKHFQRLLPIFDGMVKERRLSRATSLERKNDFLDAILDEQEDQKGIDISEHELRMMLVELFLTGTDTSSDTVEWAMSELLRNPLAMAKAQEEIREKVEAGKEVGESDAARLPYLRAVVKESLRLHPPTPLLLPRQAEADVTIGGYTIPKGTQVTINEWAILRDEKVWPEPTSFKPERFLESQVDFRGHDFELIPFGAGRRICLGMPLADRMVHLMLASLLHSFDWKLPDGMEPKDMDMRDNFGLTLEKLVPLYAIPVERK